MKGRGNLGKKLSNGNTCGCAEESIYSKVLIMRDMAHTEVVLSLEKQNGGDDRQRE